LLIALFLTGIVVMSIMRLYIVQHDNYVVQDDVVTMQQSARASIDELTRQIRMAGHHLPLGLPAIIASNTNPDTITITYHGNDCETYLSAPMPQPSAELKCGSDVSCFSTNQWVYIYEPDSAKGEWFKISHVQPGSNHVQHNYDPKALSRKYGADALLMALNRVKFFIDNTTNPDNPTLMVQIGFEPPAPYAEHIIDLQFQYRITNGSLLDEPVLVSDVREVLITVVAESTLPEFDGDTAPGKVRTYRSSVNVRNI
jgi:hypothetical protein